MKILVMNIGSTSLKYRLLQMPEGTELTRGHVERIGEPGGDCPDYGAAITRCRTEITGPGRPLEDLRELSGIGFKAVHGGPLSGVRVVDDDVLAAMEEFAFLAPAGAWKLWSVRRGDAGLPSPGAGGAPGGPFRDGLFRPGG